MSARLLVVDDQAAQLTALCETLRVEGHEVDGFTSSRHALQRLAPGRYDLLLTDLRMPEVDGLELLAAAHAIDPDLAGIVMTGHGSIDTAVAAMKHEADDYILKPFRLHTVLTVITRALEARRLRLAHAQLQQRERQQAADLAAAYGDLETFSYSVSHDLRAPLRAIRGYGDILMADHGATLEAEGQRVLQCVLDNAVRMDRMITDLLAFSRFGRQQLDKRPVDLRKLVEHVTAELRAQEPERSIEVSIHDLPGCVGDPALLQHVVENLLSNAMKFTRRCAGPRIEVGYGEAAYFVRDNGAGFDPAHAHQLFGVFQRLHSQEEFDGTGVGLSIVRRILERHGGRIWATSKPGEGATFWFVV